MIQGGLALLELLADLGDIHVVQVDRYVKCKSYGVREALPRFQKMA